MKRRSESVANQPLSAKSLVRQNPPGGTLPRYPQHTFQVNLFAVFTVNIEIAKLKVFLSSFSGNF